jgi:NAD(P)-dependent dehydrogenase (short-subunit alcohol dehydrogenase family)
MEIDFAGKVALVMGASQGIGRKIAQNPSNRLPEWQ